MSIYEEEDTATVSNPIFVERGFTVGFPVFGTNAPMAVSPAPNPYCTGIPVTAAGMTWINPNSFQLFSTGQDRYWGLGGSYVQNSLGTLSALPILPSPAISPTPPNDPGDINNDFYGIINMIQGTGVRFRETDNLTNFSGGRLD